MGFTENNEYENLNEDNVDIELSFDFEETDAKIVDTSEIECESASDGLIYSLSNLGKVDIEYISKITGKSFEEVILELKGSIFQNPLTWDEVSYKGWETKEEYLSGNLRLKYKQALEANEKYEGVFSDNLEAIQVITNGDESITFEDIYFTLGSPWIPVEIIEKFIEDLLGASKGYNTWSVEVRHDALSGTWSVHKQGDFSYYSYYYDKYGTKRMDVFKIIEKTLNQSPIVVKDFVSNRRDKSKVVLKNESETIAALDRQKEIVEKFKEWVTNNEEVKIELTNAYNEMYCQNHVRYFSGDFLKFPEMSKSVHLFEYQKNAIARIIFTKNTLLAHDVGSGKTYEMIAAGQELKRIKLSNKNMFVVPNSIIKQWEMIYKEMYPNAKLLVVNKRNFNPSNREATLIKMRDGDYDAIIIAYSSFSMIPLSPDYYKEKIENDLLKKQEAYKNRKTATKNVVKAVEKVEEHKIKIAQIGLRKNDEIYFDDLGIDRLFVDEAHNFKNISLDTDIQTLGINAVGSSKCNDMMDKVHYIQGKHDGGGVVFATGTPITNSITDIFAMQKYLQEGELELLNLSTFNAWIANFAEMVPCFEVDVDTSKFRIAQRYSKFHNIPELSSILSNIIDFHRIEQSDELPEFNGYIDIVTEPDKKFKEFLEDISLRADEVRHHKPRVLIEGPTKEQTVYDNMLVITSDGRKAALDLRLVDNYAPFNYDYKVNVCARKVYEIYKATDYFKGTQLVFCDVSTPKKNKFNIYTEMKGLLVDMGIPLEEIQFIHDFDSDSRKEKLLKQVNKGEVRVLLGSTFKLGTGINVQENLYAVHHIDVPWRPSDMIQRNGRILRLGNKNKEIFIFRYILKNSFDAYSWQLLETKQNFIHKILHNSVFFRDASDIDDLTLNYAEVKALAIGEPLLKERVEIYNELQTLKKLKYKAVENREKIRMRLFSLETKIPEIRNKIENAQFDLEHSKTIDFLSIDEEGKRVIGDELYDKLLENQMYRKENIIGEYFGFKVIAPDFQMGGDDKLSVYLERNGRYHLKINKNPISLIKRIEKFILELDKYLYEQKIKLNECLEYENTAKVELENNNNISYDELIFEKQEQLAEIDEKLGVNKEDNDG